MLGDNWLLSCVTSPMGNINGVLLMMTKNTRWKKCNIDELIGADYALRIFRTSPVLRGEALKQCEELINECRMEINARPDECKERESRDKK